MPHCNKGHELQVGDRVLIECVVESVQASYNYCNVTLKTVRGMPPYGDKDGCSTFTLNTKQCEKIV